MSKALKAPKSPNPRRSDSVEIVDALVEAGRQLVADGVESVTMSAVATRAGVGIASLYRYFPDKTALFAEVFRRQHEHTLRAVTDSLRDQPSVEEGIRLCVQSFAHFDRREVDVRRALNFDMPLDWSIDELSSVLEHARYELVTWLCGHMPEVPVAEMQTRVFFGLAFARGAVMLRLQQPESAPGPDELVHTVTKIVVDIVTGRLPASSWGATQPDAGGLTRPTTARPSAGRNRAGG